MKKNDLYSFIEVLDTYKNGFLGISLIPDDCKLLSEKLKKVCQEYGIKEYEEE